MKEVSFTAHHPDHGHMTVKGHIDHDGFKPHNDAAYALHGDIAVGPDDAHGDHQGGVNSHMQSQMKAHAEKLGAGDHTKHPALKLGKPLGKSEYSPIEAAIEILKKSAEVLEKAEHPVIAKYNAAIQSEGEAKLQTPEGEAKRKAGNKANAKKLKEMGKAELEDSNDGKVEEIKTKKADDEEEKNDTENADGTKKMDKSESKLKKFIASRKK